MPRRVLFNIEWRFHVFERREKLLQCIAVVYIVDILGEKSNRVIRQDDVCGFPTCKERHGNPETLNWTVCGRGIAANEEEDGRRHIVAYVSHLVERKKTISATNDIGQNDESTKGDPFILG